VNSPIAHDPYQALRFRDFRLLLTGNVVSSLGGQMMALGIGWELYERTNSAFALGMVGLVQLMPVILLSLVTGHVADRYNRRTIVILAKIVRILSSLGMAALSFTQGPLVAIYGCLLVQGIAEAFHMPAASGLPAQVLPEEAFENSATWSTTAMTMASVVGPAVGGLVIASFGRSTLVYVINAVAAAIYLTFIVMIRGKYASAHGSEKHEEKPSLQFLLEGIRFLRRTPVIFSAITLDLFAVLFGGATTLLPIFAKDILHVGPSGLGWLQAASSIGAASVALYLTHRPPLQRAGPTLLLVVAGFGIATIFFGLSQSFWLSFVMLLILGGLDSVSMVIRDTLVLTRTPHEMRGRVAAIEGLFVNSSNQLGGFESGVTAQFVGPVLSVIGGGIGTIMVVLIIATTWPELRRLTTLRDSSATVSVLNQI
jgi:MFS family permease